MTSTASPKQLCRLCVKTAKVSWRVRSPCGSTAAPGRNYAAHSCTGVRLRATGARGRCSSSKASSAWSRSTPTSSVSPRVMDMRRPAPVRGAAQSRGLHAIAQLPAAEQVRARGMTVSLDFAALQRLLTGVRMQWRVRPRRVAARRHDARRTPRRKWTALHILALRVRSAGSVD